VPPRPANGASTRPPWALGFGLVVSQMMNQHSLCHRPPTRVYGSIRSPQAETGLLEPWGGGLEQPSAALLQGFPVLSAYA
jgi:hypothetical protein